MSQNANTDKPQLTLIKREVSPSPNASVMNLTLILNLALTQIWHYPADLLKNQTNQTSSESTFSELLKAQSQLIQRINYFSDELEFNLD